MREASGILFDPVIIAPDGPIATALRSRGQQYAACVAEGGKDHSYGPPHLHIFEALVEALVSLGEKVGQSKLEKLKKHVPSCTQIVTNVKIPSLFEPVV